MEGSYEPAGLPTLLVATGPNAITIEKTHLKIFSPALNLFSKFSMNIGRQNMGYSCCDFCNGPDAAVTISVVAGHHF
jgi:hypothetical protein